MNKDGDARPVPLGDGRTFANKASIKVQGFAINANGIIVGAVHAWERASMALWFKRRAHL